MEMGGTIVPSTTPIPNPIPTFPTTATIPPIWENEIKSLRDKVFELGLQLEACTKVQGVVEQLNTRVDLMEGRLNLMYREMDQFRTFGNGPSAMNSQHLAEGKFARWENPEMMIAEPSINEIKQERFYDISMHPTHDNFDDSWIMDDDDDGTELSSLSGINRNLKAGRPAKRSRGRPSSSQKSTAPFAIKSKPRARKKLIVGPNPVLIDKSKELLASVLRSEITSKFHCPDCEKQFSHKKDLMRHHYVHSGLKPYQCTMCAAAFTRGDKLTKHVEHYHPDLILDQGAKSSSQKFTCRLCDKSITFSHADRLAEHYTRIHSTPDGVLPAGGASTVKGIQSLINCSLCGKPFESADDVARHRLTHATPAGYKCDWCDKIYSRADKLKTHYAQKHASSGSELGSKGAEGHIDDDEAKPQIQKQPKIHKCQQCDKEFSQKSRLDRHTVACQGLKPFHCDECGRDFTQKSSLIQHKACVHQKVKRFLCADCGQCFYGSTNYKKHVRSHRGIKPYPCKICGRCFNGQGDLKMHERIHTGIRNIQCPQCDLKFYRPYTLKRHMLVHTGEKPFMCDLCGTSFSQSGSLKKHKECHDRGGANFTRKPMSEGLKKIRVETKPRESRLLRQMMKNSVTFEEQQNDPVSIPSQQIENITLEDQKIIPTSTSSCFVTSIPVLGLGESSSTKDSVISHFNVIEQVYISEQQPQDIETTTTQSIVLINPDYSPKFSEF